MTSATSTDDGALVKTAAARVGFSSLPLDVISTHILRSDFLPEPGDLRSLRAVSKDMRDAVDATGREIKKLSNLEAAELGYLSLLKDRRTRGLPSYFWKKKRVSGVRRRSGIGNAGTARGTSGRACTRRMGGQLEVLKWLRENAARWTSTRVRTRRRAATSRC
jgi:hypothetical protein